MLETSTTFVPDKAHYAMASAIAAMAIFWWKHVNSLTKSRDKEVEARVSANEALKELAEEVEEMRKAMVKLADRTPRIGEETAQRLKKPRLDS